MNKDTTDKNDSTEFPLNSSADTITPQNTPAASAECPSGPAGQRPEGEDIVLWPLLGGGVTKISAGDVDAVAQRVWRAVRIAGHSYAYTTLDHRREYLHRFICGEPKYWDEGKCTWKPRQVDHIDNDGMNNTRQNLRSCDHRTNQQNGVGHPMARRSRWKGVSFCKGAKSHPWRAIIHIGGRQLSGGHFASEEAAAQKYNEMAREYFGEFARLNDLSAAASIEQTKS
jgi:hypothetical protein